MLLFRFEAVVAQHHTNRVCAGREMDLDMGSHIHMQNSIANVNISAIGAAAQRYFLQFGTQWASVHQQLLIPLTSPFQSLLLQVTPRNVLWETLEMSDTAQSTADIHSFSIGYD